jgi:hypothetical protein
MSTEFRGLQVAIDIINKEADTLANDFGTVDPETGALEFGRGQRANFRLETYNDLKELADKIEAHRAEIVDDEKPQLHPQTLAPNSVSIIGTMRAISAAIRERRNK